MDLRWAGILARKGARTGATLLAVLLLPAAAHAQLFEAPLDCTTPRMGFLRGVCADPQLLALARATEARLEALRTQLARQPALLDAALGLNQAFASAFRVSFQKERMQPYLALERHKAVLDAIAPRAGNDPRGAWASSSVDLTVTGSKALEASMRSQGFGQNDYDCRWKARLKSFKGGWRTDVGPSDSGVFHVLMTRKKAAMEVTTPPQAERAPDDCPPWASFSGGFVPVSAQAKIESLPGWVLPQRDSKNEKPASLSDMLARLPGPPIPEHAPDLSRASVIALAEGHSVEGWTAARPKPETLVISRNGSKDLVAFLFTDKDHRSFEIVARHKERWHLAEWHLRADNRTLFFSVPSLLLAVERLFLSDRGGLNEGLPRDKTELKLTDDLRNQIDRLQSCRYFGVTHKASASLSQSEIDRNRTSSRCDDLARDEAEIRVRRAAYPDALRVLDLANQLVDE